MARQLVGHGRQGEQSTAAPAPAGDCALIVALAAASYVMRIVVPMGRTVLDFRRWPICRNISAFSCWARSPGADWLRTPPTARLGRAWHFVRGDVAALPHSVAGHLGGTFRFLGSGAGRQPSTRCGIRCFAVGWYWHRLGSSAATSAARALGTFLAQQSYAVHIIHSTLIVIIAYGLYLA